MAMSSAATDMVASGSANAQLAVAKHCNDVNLLIALLAQADDVASHIIISRKVIPAELLAPFANSSNATLRRIAAATASFTKREWLTLVRDDDHETRLAVAANPNAPADVIKELADQWIKILDTKKSLEAQQRAIRLLVTLVRRDSISTETLARLARCKVWGLRCAVAQHVSCSSDILAKLAGDPFPAVRAAAASNPATPERWLRTLGRDLVAFVRLNVAANPTTPGDVIESLCATTHPTRGTAHQMTSLANVIDRNESSDDAAKRATASSRWIRGLAAAHPHAPLTTLIDVADGLTEQPWVLANVARNPRCPAELSEQIKTWLAIGGAGLGAPDFDPRSCNSNPHDQRVPNYQYFAELAKSVDNPELHALWPVRNAAMSGSMQLTTLATLATDPIALIRSRVLGFSPLRLAIAEGLCLDTEPGIAARATRARQDLLDKQKAKPRRARKTSALAVPIILTAIFIVRHDGSGGGATQPFVVPNIQNNAAANLILGNPQRATLTGPLSDEKITDLPFAGSLAIGRTPTDNLIVIVFTGGSRGIRIEAAYINQHARGNAAMGYGSFMIAEEIGPRQKVAFKTVPRADAITITVLIANHQPVLLEYEV